MITKSGNRLFLGAKWAQWAQNGRKSEDIIRTVYRQRRQDKNKKKAHEYGLFALYVHRMNKM